MGQLDDVTWDARRATKYHRRRRLGNDWDPGTEDHGSLGDSSSSSDESDVEDVLRDSGSQTEINGVDNEDDDDNQPAATSQVTAS